MVGSFACSADVERQERALRQLGYDKAGMASLQPWYAHPEHVNRVRAALQNCIQHLDYIASQDYQYIVWTNEDYEKWVRTGEGPASSAGEEDEAPDR